jgi:tetratricopeptide (TPR) repeat protein
MDRSTTFFSWAPQSLTVWLLIVSATALLARQAPDQFTPEVPQLYAQAKGTQQPCHGHRKVPGHDQARAHLAAAYNNLGMLYFKDRDYNHAVEVPQSALAIDPNLHTASAMLGMSYFQLGVYEKAEPLLRQP